MMIHIHVYSISKFILMPFFIKKFVGLKSLTDNGIMHKIIYDCLRSFFAIKIYEFWNDQ